ncbi:hypothetical protein KY317_00650 [Candidatus Woesearchaeota archaeon]|nr:hypothetical protein [Candidatus Woesearchaeota archaeon]
MADADDSDSYGISDNADDFSYTPFGASVDEHGCSAAQRDIDGDGIDNSYDKCDHTPYNEIDDFVTDSSDEYYGCSPSERPSSKLLALIILTFGFIFVIGGISYLIYIKHIAGKRGFKSILKKQKQPGVKILRAVAPRPAKQQIEHIVPVKKTPGAEERRKKAIAEIKKRIAEKRKRKKMFKEFEK